MGNGLYVGGMEEGEPHIGSGCVEAILCRFGNDDFQCAGGTQQHGRTRCETFEGKSRGGVARLGTMCDGRKKSFLKEGGIAHNGVKKFSFVQGFLVLVVEKVTTTHCYLCSKGRVVHILRCLSGCFRLNFKCHKAAIRKTLSEHERNESATASHIEHTRCRKAIFC